MSDVYEREVQRRLADRMAAAGVPHSQISLAVLYMLPTEFVDAYVRLFEEALADPTPGSLRDSGNEGQPAKVDARYKGKRPGITGGGKRYRTHWSIRDEAKFKLKGSVDRKLRRIALEISKGTVRETDRELPCIHCGSDLSWAVDGAGKRFRELLQYCPRCGKRLESS